MRSSKTLSSIVAWLAFVEQSPHREFLMTGKTSDTLYRNVIDGATGILAIMGRRAKYNKCGQGGAKLCLTFGRITKICYCVGAHNEGSEGRIRGMTIAGWYADEVTLYPESFVKQAINRMSLPGARAFWTTNPDSPYHYINTEFIQKAKEKGYKHWHFELDDNYSLTKEYKENLKKAYSGLWYKRMVQGLWVLAEGAIYDMFDQEKGGHVVDDLPDRFERYFIGVDYGTSNPCVFLLFGESAGVYYCIKEYYYDSKKTSRQKSDDEYAVDFVAFVGDVALSAIYIDPSAASFIVALKKRRVRNIKEADNSVLDGLRTQATLLANRKYFIHRSCKNTIGEYGSYVWDVKAQERGEDKPVKKFDHGKDAERYALHGEANRTPVRGSSSGQTLGSKINW